MTLEEALLKITEFENSQKTLTDKISELETKNTEAITSLTSKEDEFAKEKESWTVSLKTSKVEAETFKTTNKQLMDQLTTANKTNNKFEYDPYTDTVLNDGKG